MASATGFTNSFTAGEISEDAWDRVDIQQTQKGCEAAINYVPQIAGPLRKRRGFWRLGDVADTTKQSRLVAFRRGIDDALMLEFADGVVRVWNNNGAPLMDGPDQVVFDSPYAEADLAGLRWKQVVDVIYLRGSDGRQPRSLTRDSNTSWTFAVEDFPNGPWRPENPPANNVTLSLTGTDEEDVHFTETGAGSILAGTDVAIAASGPVFDPAMVGGYFRLRQGDGTAGVKSWEPAFSSPVGLYVVSNGHVYRCSKGAGDLNNATTPPVNLSGSQSDGGNTWDYRHDGAGIVRITAVTDAMTAAGVVIATAPLISGELTTYWSEGAYSDYRGWPRMWPSMREERLVEGATASNLDYVDLTETAGFTPTSESFSPGLGTGAVVDTDAIRRRCGTEGAELIWGMDIGYLIVGSVDGEYLVAGTVLDEPLSPAGVIDKQQSSFGSSPAVPVKAHKGLLHITLGKQTVRLVTIDNGQGYGTKDLTVLARHIGDRGFEQLAWVRQPDNAAWARLSDGGLAVFTYHDEEQVEAWARVALGGGWICEDLATLPGPGQLETLWMIVSRVKAGVTQRQIWLQSQVSDGLFMDGAALYSGAPTTGVEGLTWLAGEPVRLLADGVMYDVVADDAGHAALPPGTTASTILAGSGYRAYFKSLKLARVINETQQVKSCIVNLKTALAWVGMAYGDDEGMPDPPMEKVLPRRATDTPGAAARRIKQSVTLAGDSTRDARIVVTDDTAYGGEIFSLKPMEA